MPALPAPHARRLAAVLLCGLALSGCGGSAQLGDSAAATSAAPATDSTSAAPATDSTTAADPDPRTANPSAAKPAPSDRSADRSAANPAAGPSATGPSATAPLRLPSGPATRAAPPPIAPGSLGAVDWTTRRYDGACPGVQVGPAVLGDLDGDGRDEAAVPLTCPGPPDQGASVLVYAGDADRPILVGRALQPEERATLHGLQVRDAHLVVTTLTRSSADPDAEPDTAVTTRWRVSGGTLVGTDRWSDPAAVLDVDEG